MKTYYEIISETTGEIVAYTIITGFESDDEEITIDDIIQTRIEASIDNGMILFDSYDYFKSNKQCIKNLKEI